MSQTSHPQQQSEPQYWRCVNPDCTVPQDCIPLSVGRCFTTCPFCGVQQDQPAAVTGLRGENKRPSFTLRPDTVSQVANCGWYNREFCKIIILHGIILCASLVYCSLVHWCRKHAGALCTQMYLAVKFPYIRLLAWRFYKPWPKKKIFFSHPCPCTSMLRPS